MFNDVSKRGNGKEAAAGKSLVGSFFKAAALHVNIPI